MSHRLDTLARQLFGGTVTEYKYWMNDKHTGYLYLLHSTEEEKTCMWLSTKTGLYTRWHGRWSMFADGGVYANFDYLGKTNSKWAEFDGDGFGEDYQGRTIRVELGRKWHFDPATMTFFDEPLQ